MAHVSLESLMAGKNIGADISGCVFTGKAAKLLKTSKF